MIRLLVSVFNYFKEKFAAGLFMGVMTVTLFYIDKSSTREDRKIIESFLEKKKCAAAIYDCSYYLFLNNEQNQQEIMVYREIWNDLRNLYTNNEILREKVASIIRNPIDWVGRRNQIMSNEEFASITKEMYEIKIEVNQLNQMSWSENIAVLKIQEYNIIQNSEDKVLLFERNFIFSENCQKSYEKNFQEIRE